MSIKLGSTLLAGVATNTIANAHSLLDFKWADHILDEMSWLRADTFSWQSGAVYAAAYNHILADYNGGTQKTETVGLYTITFYEADDGHKICLPDQEATVVNIYGSTGVAWYYILDTTNTRFKLPRTMFGFTGLRDTVGKYIEGGLPNLTGSTGLAKATGDPTGMFKVGSSYNTSVYGGSATVAVIEADASSYNSIYGNSSTVQPPATQMYLYFYVGQFSQSATEQTAGLNAELFNVKADVDLSNAASNASSAAKATIVGWGMPDLTSQYTTTTLPYTVPKNSYVFAYGQISAWQAHIEDTTNNSILTWFSSSATNAYAGSGTCVVEAGTEITVTGCNNGTVTLYVTPMKGTS